MKVVLEGDCRGIGDECTAAAVQVGGVRAAGNGYVQVVGSSYAGMKKTAWNVEGVAVAAIVAGPYCGVEEAIGFGDV